LHRKKASCRFLSVTTDGAPQTFGDRLRAARAAAGLTQEEVARRSGVTLRLYAGLERGEGEPRGRNLVRIAAAVNVTAEDLFPAAVETA
jgi:transcriptional regulator with XRE-family HTH domain